MVPSILPKNERWDNFQYIKVYQRSFFGRIEDTIICFRDCLTFTIFFFLTDTNDASQLHEKILIETRKRAEQD